MPLTTRPLTLDGAYGEGGASLVRTALVMSALTQTPVTVQNVRGAMRQGGLAAEDLTLLSALGSCCDAEVSGAEFRSREFSFVPQGRPHALKEPISHSNVPESDPSVAAMVVLNALLPVLCQTKAYSTVVAEGETYGHRILTYDYYEQVALSAYRAMGVHAYPHLIVAGYGKGPAARSNSTSSRAFLTASIGRNVAPSKARLHGSPSPRCRRGSESAAWLTLRGSLGARESNSMWSTRSCLRSIRACSVTVWGQFATARGGATAKGERGIRVESVVQSAFGAFLEWYSSGSTVDEFLADQVLVALAFAEGDSALRLHRVTQRLQTMVWVIKQFLPIHITLRGGLGEPGELTVRR
ncbi:MAG: RNA 3'-terminal phosphate cyclase [Armatimonadetes bacterium OLB18]|nr:MAG: RNA 3'-terminal phosphate cyclase [Armatimonadetes bacterium OLB18]